MGQNKEEAVPFPLPNQLEEFVVRNIKASKMAKKQSFQSAPEQHRTRHVI